MTRCAPATERIYAVGECVEHRGQVFGLVAPLWDMAKVCADRITDAADTDYVPAVSGTRLKVTGIDMFSAGDFMGDDDDARRSCSATPLAASTSGSCSAETS